MSDMKNNLIYSLLIVSSMVACTSESGGSNGADAGIDVATTDTSVRQDTTSDTVATDTIITDTRLSDASPIVDTVIVDTRPSDGGSSGGGGLGGGLQEILERLCMTGGSLPGVDLSLICQDGGLVPDPCALVPQLCSDGGIGFPDILGDGGFPDILGDGGLPFPH